MSFKVRAIFLIISSIVLICGCNSKPENDKGSDPDMISVKIDQKGHTDVSFFDYYGGIEIIPLETTTECIIKEATKLIVLNGTTYILDSDQKSLFLFNENGKYLNKISNVGSGPGEYFELYDFCINRFTENIELLDPFGRIHIYSPDLTYLKSLRIDVRAVHQFINMNKDTIVFYSESEAKKVLFYSRSTETVFHRTFSFDDKLRQMPESSMGFSRLQLIGNKVVLFLPYSNIIYEIQDTTVSNIHREWDFGKYNFKPHKIEADQPIAYYVQYAMNLKNEAFSFFLHFELERLVITRFIFNGKWMTLYYNKTDGSYDYFRKFTEDVSPPIIGYLDEQFAYTVTDIARISEPLNKNILTPEQAQLIESITPENNPVIIKYRLKQHE
jgi:hypothetical protein